MTKKSFSFQILDILFPIFFSKGQIKGVFFYSHKGNTYNQMSVDNCYQTQNTTSGESYFITSQSATAEPPEAEVSDLAECPEACDASKYSGREEKKGLKALKLQNRVTVISKL